MSMKQEMQMLKSGSNPPDKSGDYGVKRGGASKGYGTKYNPKQCPPKANLGVTPTNSTKRG